MDRPIHGMENAIHGMDCPGHPTPAAFPTLKRGRSRASALTVCHIAHKGWTAAIVSPVRRGNPPRRDAIHRVSPARGKAPPRHSHPACASRDVRDAMNRVSHAADIQHRSNTPRPHAVNIHFPPPRRGGAPRMTRRTTFPTDFSREHGGRPGQSKRKKHFSLLWLSPFAIFAG